MTEELNLLREALRRVKYEAASLADAQVIALEALTQRPAAQAGEREAFEAWFDDYYDKACAEFGGIDCTDPKGIAEDAWQARASLPAPQQATPEPVQFDQAGHFYNLVGHALMDVERPDACAHRLRLILDELAALMGQPATPEPVGEAVAWWYIEDGEEKFGHPNGYRPDDARPLVFGDTRPAPGVPEGFALVPVEPTAAMLHCIVYDQYPQDADEGRKLQRKQLGEPNSEDHVPFKTEFELAVGQYKRLLAAAQAKGADK